MNKVPADRNLLVGMLALQLGLIDQSQLIAALQAWVFRKQDQVENILLEQLALSDQSHGFLSQVFRQYVEIHRGDVTKSLATLPHQEDAFDFIEELADQDLTGSVSDVTQLYVKNSTKTVDGENPAAAVPARARSNHSSRFQILRPHARGGLGKLSIAFDKELHREVALKQIQSRFLNSPDSRARFLIEAEVTGRLEHPGIVPVYSLGETENGHPFYAMKFIRGISLKEALDQLHAQPSRLTPHQSRFELRQLVQRLVDVGNTIEYAHSRGVLHRDLKPENIMLGKYGETLVVDWGLAKAGPRSPEHEVVDDASVIMASGSHSSQTRLGAVFGTPGYMSPEQARGDSAAITTLSDVYSLGATLYAVITGKAPAHHPGNQDQGVPIAIAPADQINPHAPRDLCAICAKAMASRPADRYPSAHAMVMDLEAWLADEPVTARQSSLTERLARTTRRYRTTTAVVATLILATLLATTTFLYSSWRQNQLLRVAHDQAVGQRDRADANLSSLQALVITLIDTCENELRNVPEALPVRMKLTQASERSFQQLYADNSSADNLRLQYAHVLRVLSNLHRLSESYEAAESHIRQSLELQNAISPDQLTSKTRVQLVETYRDLATLLQSEGKLAQSSQALQQARERMPSPDSEQGNVVDQLRLAYGLSLEEAKLRAALGEPEKGIELARLAQSLAQQARRATLENDNDNIVLAFAWSRELRILFDMQRFPEVVERGRTALQEVSNLNIESDGNPNLSLALARIQYLLGQAIAEADARHQATPDANDTESEPLIRTSIATLQALFEKQKQLQQAYSLIHARLALARVHILHQRLADCETELQQIQLQMQQAGLDNQADNADELLALWHQQSAQLLTAQNKLDEARQHARDAIKHQSLVCEKQPESVEARELLRSWQKQLSP